MPAAKPDAIEQTINNKLRIDMMTIVDVCHDSGYKRVMALNEQWQRNLTRSTRPFGPVVRKDDVFLCGPPKSGTTWLTQITNQIRIKGDNTIDFRDIHDIAWYLPPFFYNFSFNYDGDQPIAGRRIFKTHDTFDQVPKYTKGNSDVKYIIVLRNPWDQCYSMCHFLLRYYGGSHTMDADTYKAIFDHKGRSLYPTFFNLFTSWYSHRNEPNVLWLHYEDLISDLSQCVGLVSDFMGESLTGEQTAAVVHSCSHAYMAEHNDQFATQALMEGLCDAEKMEHWSIAADKVRRDGGQVNQGANNLGPELTARIDGIWESEIRQPFGFTSYEELYNSCSALN